jgi:hypothetical protein
LLREFDTTQGRKGLDAGKNNNKMKNIEKYLDSIGEKSSTERLGVIASMNLGNRSEAARRVCEKRYRRKELMDKGLSFEYAVLIVNKENNKK